MLIEANASGMAKAPAASSLSFLANVGSRVSSLAKTDSLLPSRLPPYSITKSSRKKQMQFCISVRYLLLSINLTLTIPHELCTKVYKQLGAGTEPIANMRLVSKFWCKVATPFLVWQIRLVFTRENFQRLTAISDHPGVSRTVTSIYSEADMLENIDFAEWESSLRVDIKWTDLFSESSAITALLRRKYDITKRTFTSATKLYLRSGAVR